ncbi:bactofilin family protein [Amphibacillus cookii]|uniref:bactofilin family protein n=1 Tax=Amphibacillus cookii TaxID=767787 RepID=UPI001959859A|nr:polymer-forming cytoskeletal protein [Amphibacillus cookii]MBM7541015.1 cytoskeletal protein CcmA (bactofilin family) [Amphibacillus cookii]
MLKGKKQEDIIDTVIGKDTTIEGKVSLSTSLRIDGKVHGEIECNGDVFIGKDGFAEPSIKAKNVVIAGEAKGDIETSAKVHVQTSGVLTGNITSAGIIIDEGGIFNGSSTVKAKERKSSKRKTEPANNDEH